MELTLRPDLQQFVDEKVRAGQYSGAAEVLEEALVLLREQERSCPEELEELRREIQIGLDASAAGQTAPWSADEIKSEGRRLLQQAPKAI